MDKEIVDIEAFTYVEITEISIEDGLVAKLKEILSKARQYGSERIKYLVGTDIVDYIKAHESIIEKISPRTRIEQAVTYFSYAKTFLVRAAPTLLELDGIRHVAEGSYKIGLGELASGAYINVMDYFAIRRRSVYIETVALAKKQLQNKTP